MIADHSTTDQLIFGNGVEEPVCFSYNDLRAVGI